MLSLVQPDDKEVGKGRRFGFYRKKFLQKDKSLLVTRVMCIIGRELE